MRSFGLLDSMAAVKGVWSAVCLSLGDGVEEGGGVDDSARTVLWRM